MTENPDYWSTHWLSHSYPAMGGTRKCTGNSYQWLQDAGEHYCLVLLMDDSGAMPSKAVHLVRKDYLAQTMLQVRDGDTGKLKSVDRPIKPKGLEAMAKLREQLANGQMEVRNGFLVPTK